MHRRSSQEYLEELRRARIAQLEAKARRRRRRVVALAVLSVLVACTTAVAIITVGVQRSRKTGSGSVPSTVLTPSPAATTAPGPTAQITGVGDVILGAAPQLPPENGATFFDGVRGQLTGDVVMGNLESPLTADTGVRKCPPPATPPPATPPPATPPPATPPPATPPAGPTPTSTPSANTRCFAFRVPPSYARALKTAGFTLLSLANNHAHDFGPAGLRNTRAALDAQGLAHTGAPDQITVVRAGSIRVAVIGVAPYPWAQTLTDIEDTQRLVREAAGRADLVVVNMHAGAEGADRTHVRAGVETFIGENRGDPIAFAHGMVDAGADLVVGHSPHVMRGMEFYKGRLIAYSMGNFAGYRVLRRTGPLGIGGILKVTLRKDGTWVGGMLVPTMMVAGGLPATDPARQAVALVDSLSAADFGSTAVRVAPSGALQVPATR